MKRFIVVIISGIVLASCANEVKKEPVVAETNVAEEVTEKMPVVNAEATKMVIEHHLQAFGSGDIEAIMSDYTEESVVITPEATLRGLEQIKGLFTQMLTMFPEEGSEFVLDRMDIDNELGYIFWHANTPVVEIPLGTDTYIVQDGKIMKQTFAAKLNMVAAE